MTATTVPTVGRACVVTQRGVDYKLAIREDYPVPTPAAGEILIRIIVTGICLSDIHCAEADCPGHEGSGVVAAIGPGVEGWAIGDRAGVKPAMDTCGQCEMCREGYEMNCPKGIMAMFQMNGTYAQYLVHPARYATRIPAGIADDVCAPMLCAGATTYRAFNQTGCRLGQWLIVAGAGGGVGHIAAQYGAAAGVRVIAIDTSEAKRDLCLNKLGCEAFIDFGECKDIPAEVMRITGRGAHGIIVTGANQAAYSGWVEMLRVGGTVVCVGLPPKGTVIVGADPIDMVMKSLTVKGSLVANFKECDEAIAVAAAGKVTPIVKVYPFSEFVQAFDDVHHGKVAGRAVVAFDDDYKK
ncbi:hypothetical protein RQP46_002513 [Phenoliferia psychrophenolica]